MTLPVGWKKISLRHLADVRTGLSKSEKRQGILIKRPYLRVANVQDGYIDLSEIKAIDVPVNQLERFTLHEGDIVLTEGGDFDKLGRGYVWENKISDCVHQNHIFAVRIHDRKTLNPWFLSFQMQSRYGRKYFLSCAKQTTNLASINAGQLKQFPVLFPSFNEQLGIIEFISAWDLAIEKIVQLASAKEKVYSYALSYLFSHINHPHTHINTFAAEVTKRNKNAAYKRVLSVTNRNGFVLPEEQFNRRVASTDLSNYKVVLNGQYAYNPSRINVGSIARLDDYDMGVLSPMYTVLQLDETKVNSDYFKHWLNLHEAKERIKRSAQGSVRETVSFSEFSSIHMPLPSMEKQKSIARYLNSVREEIALLYDYAEKLKLQKRGLMQKLLTGKWRVRPDEGEVTE
ncbi:MAG: Type-1 restriction enzyme EcoKI specificity protein [Syntrophorhabdus sp. PtaU1.Bin058]|nr:MAG: Type-1 restriction enzyme EcoKI specificity protein [Syntrophorhabdus sp. PtaU1.Bin058]